MSLGLVGTLLCLLVFARGVGLFTDPDASTIAKRHALTDAIAIECNLAAQRGQKPTDAAPFIKAMMRHEPELLSVGVRLNNRLLLDMGDHEIHWQDYAGESSTPTHHYVDINRVNGLPWGRVEVCCQPLPYGGWWQYLGGSLLPLYFVTALILFISITLYSRFIYQYTEGMRSKLVQHRVLAMVNTLNEGVLVIDRHGEIELANEAFARTLGTTPDELQSRNVSELPWVSGQPGDHADSHPWTRVLQDAGPQLQQVVQLATPGESRTLSVNTTPIHTDDGDLHGAIAIFDDLTTMEKLNEAVETANRAKGEFLANVSHEIRTPMNAVVGMANLVLESTKLTGEQRDHLRNITDSVNSLLGSLNDLLDLSKIEAGKFVLDPVDFEFRRAVEDTLQTLAPRAHRKGLELTCDVMAAVPELVVGDRNRLCQVIAHLVENAIKFTDRGEVILRIDVAEQRPGIVLLNFTVADTGVGISDDNLTAIFESIAQGSTSSMHKFGRSGLGLTISARLVELMGGQIWAESTTGSGSLFYFTAAFGVPIQTSAAMAYDDVSTLNNLNVLVVEDTLTTQLVIANMLGQMGLRVKIVDDCDSAIKELTTHSLAGTPYSITLIDSILNSTDSFILAELIVQRQLAGAVIMMLTSVNLPNDIERCRQLGVSGYISKPIRRKELARALLQAAAANDGPSRNVESNVHAAQADIAHDTISILSQDTNDITGLGSANINADAVLQRVGGNRDVLEGLLTVFYRDCNTQMKLLHQAIRAADAVAVRAAAHTIQGILAFFESKSATEAAARVEQAGIREELAGTPQLFTALAHELGQIEEVMSQTMPPPPDGWHLGRADHANSEMFDVVGA